MRRLVITLLVLVVMSPTMAMAGEWYRCTIDGQARAACCCPGEAKDGETVPSDAPPDVRATCCCDIETVSTSAAEPRMTVDAMGTALGAVVVPRVVIDDSSIRTEVTYRPAPTAAPHSSRAPPLFLSHCSLLL